MFSSNETLSQKNQGSLVFFAWLQLSLAILEFKPRHKLLFTWMLVVMGQYGRLAWAGVRRISSIYYLACMEGAWSITCYHMSTFTNVYRLASISRGAHYRLQVVRYRRSFQWRLLGRARRCDMI
jgi:hypothetical protein